MASARSASLNGGLAAEPQRGPGVQPWMGVRWVKLKAFCPFSCKKWPKFKELNANFPRV